MYAPAKTLLAVGALGLAPLAASAQDIGHADGVTPRPELDASIQQTLQQCASVAPSCTTAVDNAAGVLVFPSIVTVDLGVGGSGGSGALIQNDQIVGYYDIGEASVGVQIGVKAASQVYVLESQDEVATLQNGGQWDLSTAADLTVADANASASAQTGDPLVYVFNAEGLNAGANISALKVWQDTDAS